LAGTEGKNLGEMGSEGRPAGSFKDFLRRFAEPSGGAPADGAEFPQASDLYAWAAAAGVGEAELADALSVFWTIPHVTTIQPEEVDFKVFPRPFCEAKLVVPVKSMGSRQTVVLSNPFDWELREDLERTLPKHLSLLLASPSVLRSVLERGEVKGPDPDSSESSLEESPDPSIRSRKDRPVYDPEKDPGKDQPVAKLALSLLSGAMAEGATELHVAESGLDVLARTVLGGRVHDYQHLPAETGRMLVARFKALAGMDVAKRRTPQSGSLEILLDEKVLKLRLSTSPTARFEHLRIRVLNPEGTAPALHELGMFQDQIDTLHGIASEGRGLLLCVGPLESGKTTTLYSLLSSLANEDLHIETVEDPIQHKIPFASQNEVGKEPGNSSRALLNSAVQENPDAIFLHESRDLVSARALLDFVGQGRRGFSTLESANGATAIFRLERLGVSRSEIAARLVGVVAQRLLRRLCPECKEVRPISREEAARLQPFTSDLPSEVAHSAGCSECNGTGYRGRQGVFEVMAMDESMAEMVREGHPIGEIRDYAQARGEILLSDDALRKVRGLVFSVEDVYREILLEEGVLSLAGAEAREGSGEPEEGSGAGTRAEVGSDLSSQLGQPSILVVEDEEGTMFLLDQILTKAGFKVIQASDGGQALLKVGAGGVDLVLSDIHMPSLDGLKLLEILNQHGIDVPVILLTGEPSPDVEARGWEMGVTDYLRKPIQRDVLLDSIQKALDTPFG